MSAVDTSKWTCPSCNRSFTVYGSEPDCRCAIAAVQHRHAAAHAKTERIRALGLAGVRQRRRSA